jgi:hypothetical protein
VLLALIRLQKTLIKLLVHNSPYDHLRDKKGPERAFFLNITISFVLDLISCI